MVPDVRFTCDRVDCADSGSDRTEDRVLDSVFEHGSLYEPSLAAQVDEMPVHGLKSKGPFQGTTYTVAGVPAFAGAIAPTSAVVPIATTRAVSLRILPTIFTSFRGSRTSVSSAA
jgi:hypothetical protein